MLFPLPRLTDADGRALIAIYRVAQGEVYCHPLFDLGKGQISDFGSSYQQELSDQAKSDAINNRFITFVDVQKIKDKDNSLHYIGVCKDNNDVALVVEYTEGRLMYLAQAWDEFIDEIKDFYDDVEDLRGEDQECGECDLDY